MPRISACALGLAVILVASFPSDPAKAQTSAAPKLVVFMVVDGLPQEQLLKYSDQYGEGGFKLLLDKGAWDGNAHYSHATTYTALGHATLLSCAHPYKHGVIGNDWLDKKTKQRVYSTEDARHKYLDEETPKHSGTSPLNIRVTAVGDELIYANGRSKVIAISGKDRSAIRLAGQNGVAFMHSTTSGRFITSDFYMPDHPQWWKDFYKDKPQDKYFGQHWTLLLPEDAYARSAPDARPWSTESKRLGTRFPQPISGGANEPNTTYYDAMMWTPFGDLLTFDFVKATIEDENLGRNPAGVPDLLAVSWTSHDYVNHLFGPEYLFAKPTAYGSTHGSPWAYDTSVPLALCGPKWVKAGKHGNAEVVDLGRTLAFVLNVRPPNGCEGRVLSEILN